jgi:uncharacterized protein (TIGR03435 family)
MQPIQDGELLGQFARTGAEEAFGELVRRHIGLVHSVALRHTDNPHQAEEITQAVFIILARKAGSLGRRTVLSGWLYHTARLTAANFRRSDFRRIHREQEAFMQSTSQETTQDSAWPELAPLLDEAMARLGEADRTAVVLRYFENRTLSEVGAALGVAERAAQKRVSRALEKLRTFFTKRGVTSTTAIIADAISAHSVQAAPVALAKTITAVAVMKGAAASGSTLTLIKGTLTLMAWTKTKTVIVVGVGVLLATGTTTLTIKEIQEHRTYPWQTVDVGTEWLDRFPPQVRIASSKAVEFGLCVRNDRQMALGASAKDIVAAAYDQGPARVVFSEAPPSGKFDFFANLPSGNHEALQREVKRKFGLVGKLDVRDTDALLLKVKDSARLQSKLHKAGFAFTGRGGLTFPDEKLSVVAQKLEYIFDKPILDQTSMDGHYDLGFILNVKSWNDIVADREGVRQTLRNELGENGLELVPSREPIEMLVVEKVK